jgi:hypothetical protein
MKHLPYFVLGGIFGAVLLEAEVISWFRVQEMFRFQAFHMFGIIGSALVVAGISLEIIKRLNLRDPDGVPLRLPPKTLGRGVRYIVGGMIFGVGWALTGACPAPLVALLGAGVRVILVALASVLAGTWMYGYLRPQLPH